MDVTYEWAKTVISSANSRIESGGLIADLLTSQMMPNTSTIPKLIKQNIVKTFTHNGYPVWIFFFVLWFVSFNLGCAYLWYMRCRSIKKASISTDISERPHIKSPKLRLGTSRNKICALILILIFTLLLLTSIFMGIIATVEFYIDTSTRLQLDSNHGLISTSFIDTESPNRMLLFPRLIHALSSIDSYLEDFIPSTLKATEPYVNDLVRDTLEIQEKSSRDFASKMEQVLGTTKMPSISRNLVTKSIEIYERLEKLNYLDKKVLELIQDFKQTYENNRAEIDKIDCNENQTCKDIKSNLAFRTSFNIPKTLIIGDIPVEFLLKNMGIEQLRKNQDKATRVKEAQLLENQKALNKIINISKEVKAEANSQWSKYKQQLEMGRLEIQKIAVNITRDFHPKATKYAGIFVGLFSLIWPMFIAVTLFLFWLIFRYFLTTHDISSKSRRNTRTIGCVFLFFLSICLLFSLAIFLVGGFAFTETCRYFDQQRSMTNDGNFILDQFINSFLDWIYPKLQKNQEDKARSENKTFQPLPKIKNVIKALAIRCKDNIGVLSAFDAVKSYNFSVTYNNSLSKTIVNAGRKILENYIHQMNISQIISKKEISELNQVFTLDKKFNLTHFENMSYITVGNRPYNFYELNLLIESFLRDFGSDKDQQIYHLYKEFTNKQEKINSTINEMKKELISFNNKPAIDPIANEMENAVESLNAKLLNREVLKREVLSLYETEVAAKADEKGLMTMRKFGPRIMGAAGPCAKLHIAFEDINSGVCHGIVGPLNGLWMFTTFCILFTNFGLAFAFMTMIHRMPENVKEKHEAQNLLT